MRAFASIVAFLCLLAACTPAGTQEAPQANLAVATRPAVIPRAASAGSASPASATPTKAGQTGQAALVEVGRVVDGDTIGVDAGGKRQTVRIIGIDTPEVVDRRKPVQCFAREASARAHQLLDGQRVKLIADPTQSNRDKYDRLLRYVEKTDGTDFGLWMIANGYAHEYTYEIPYQRQAAYKEAHRQAREKSLGFWSSGACNGDTKRPA